MYKTPNPSDLALTKEGFSEQKTTTVYLHEPLSFKAIPFKDGYRIEFSAKMHWDQVDGMADPDKPILQGISNMIKIITDKPPKGLGSKVMDVVRKDDEN